MCIYIYINIQNLALNNQQEFICYTLTFDRARCSRFINYVIAGCTCVNEWKHIMWVITRICEHCEIIYTWLIADTESLAGVSLQSGVLGQDTVSYRDWLPSAQWSNSSLWSQAGKQQRQRCKGLKITQHGMAWSREEVFIGQYSSLSLSHCLSHTYTSYDPFQEIKCESYIFMKKSVMIPAFIIHSSLM